jgi:hypothetical protein
MIWHCFPVPGEGSGAKVVLLHKTGEVIVLVGLQLPIGAFPHGSPYRTSFVPVNVHVVFSEAQNVHAVCAKTRFHTMLATITMNSSAKRR